MAKDRSKIRLSLERWVVNNLYEILYHSERFTNELADNGFIEKRKTMLEASEQIKKEIVRALNEKGKENTRRDKSKNSRV